MLIIFFYDKTWFLLNVYVQSFGYYLQYIVQLGFHTGDLLNSKYANISLLHIFRNKLNQTEINYLIYKLH